MHQLRADEGNSLRAGLSRMHGLRHAYAQKRYEELTGWQCPAACLRATHRQAGGPEQREAARQARLTISREPGHEREQVTAVYLSR